MQEEQEQTNLTDILNGTVAEAPGAEAPPVAAEAAPAPSPSEAEPEPSGKSRVPKGSPGAGQFAGKSGDTTGGDATAVAPAAADAPAPEDEGGSPPPDKAPVPQAALMNERRRRQEAEGLARELKSRLDALARLQPEARLPTDAPKVAFWDDPDAVLADRFDQFGNSLLDQFEQRQLYRSINKSEAAARSRHDDFDEAIAEYERAVATNPALAREMANADDPGEFAYQKGKSLAKIHQYGGDVDALIAAEREAWEAELRAAAPSPAPSLPPSTATERSVAVARSGPAWTGPKPLGDILA